MSPIQSIVVPVDFSETSHVAVVRARSLAVRLGASIHLIHAARYPTPMVGYEFAIPEPAWQAIHDAAQKKIDTMAADLEQRGLVVTREVSDRDPSEAIDSAVRKHRADLVVMGTHGHRGLQHLLLGSVAERVIRSAQVPVMAVKGTPEDAEAPLRRILFATDFSPPSRAAREFAIALALATDASIEVCHAVAAPTQFFASYDVAPPGDLLDQLRSDARSQLGEAAKAIAESGVKGETRLVEGVASEAIIAAAAETGADVVVMGTRGHTGLRHVLLGSVAERTLRRAPCSVITVRSTDK